MDLMRELISSLLFHIGLGQSYYYDSTLLNISFSLFLYIFLAWIFLKRFSFGSKFNTYISMIVGLIVAFSSVRYSPFGGDALVYCNYIDLDLKGFDIYSLNQKYTFNYPPFFIMLLGYFCDFNYINVYPIIYFVLIVVVAFVLAKENKIDYLTTITLLASSFLGFRWILKTGNFLIWEIVFLVLACVYSKKNENITLILLVLLGFQRLWFMLIPFFWYLITKDKIKFSSLGLSGSILFLLYSIKFELLGSYVNQILEGRTINGIWNGYANHNSPSLFLNFIDLFNLHSNFLLLMIVYAILVFLLIYNIISNSIYKKNEHILSQIIFIIIIFNPTFKPYHGLLAVIAIVPLLPLLKRKQLDFYIFVSCFVINIFWILGSVIPLGYPYSIFQIVFMLSTIRIIFNRQVQINYD